MEIPNFVVSLTNCPETAKGQIPLRYAASEPARELVRELVCDLLSSWTAMEFCLSRAILLASRSQTTCEPVCDQVRAISTCRDSSNLSASGRKLGMRPALELVADLLASC